MVGIVLGWIDSVGLFFLGIEVELNAVGVGTLAELLKILPVGIHFLLGKRDIKLK